MHIQQALFHVVSPKLDFDFQPGVDFGRRFVPVGSGSQLHYSTLCCVQRYKRPTAELGNGLRDRVKNIKTFLLAAPSCVTILSRLCLNVLS
jgi:hypothetical protein